MGTKGDGNHGNHRRRLLRCLMLMLQQQWTLEETKGCGGQTVSQRVHPHLTCPGFLSFCRCFSTFTNTNFSRILNVKIWGKSSSACLMCTSILLCLLADKHLQVWWKFLFFLPAEGRGCYSSFTAFLPGLLRLHTHFLRHYFTPPFLSLLCSDQLQPFFFSSLFPPFVLLPVIVKRN